MYFEYDSEESNEDKVYVKSLPLEKYEKKEKTIKVYSSFDQNSCCSSESEDLDDEEVIYVGTIDNFNYDRIKKFKIIKIHDKHDNIYDFLLKLIEMDKIVIYYIYDDERINDILKNKITIQDSVLVLTNSDNLKLLSIYDVVNIKIDIF